MPLIGQTVNTIILAILPLAVWAIRGNIVPYENGGKLTLASLFGSKYIRTPCCKIKRGKIGKIAKFGSKYFRTAGNKDKRGKIDKIAKYG